MSCHSSLTRYHSPLAASSERESINHHPGAKRKPGCPLIRMLERTATEISQLLSRGETTSEAVTADFLTAIKQRDGKIRAFLHVDESAALTQARSVDAKRKRGESLHPLAGVPIAIKDVLCVEGRPTTCGSNILQNFVPPYDAHVITKLKQATPVLTAIPHND